MALTKIQRRERIRNRIRKVISGTAQRPRMAIFRSNKQIYVQFIDDVNANTITAISSLDKTLAEQIKGKSGVETAKILGRLAAERAIAKGITSVIFDRGGYLYHGKIKSLAESAREGGLKF
jgi:large subunit ribosomal protein L18